MGFWGFEKRGVKTRKKPVKKSLFSQHPASAKYALKLTEILLYREGGVYLVSAGGGLKKGGVKTRKKPVKMSLFSQHPASAKYALKLTEILLYREGVYLVTGGHVAGDFIPRTPKSYEDAMTVATCNVITST